MLSVLLKEEDYGCAIHPFPNGMLNPLSIFLAALATMPVGFLWYSPVLFAKPWIHHHAINTRKKKGSMVIPLLSTFLTSLVMAFLLSVVIELAQITTLSNAWKLGTLLWFGFDFMPNLTRSLFSKKPLELVLIDSGHQAANVLLVSWILMTV